MFLEQCAILYLKPGAPGETHVETLRVLGFAVDVVEGISAAPVQVSAAAAQCRIRSLFLSEKPIKSSLAAAKTGPS